MDDRKGTDMASQHIQKYNEFYDSARYDNSLEGPTTTLVHLTAAIALGCEP